MSKQQQMVQEKSQELVPPPVDTPEKKDDAALDTKKEDVAPVAKKVGSRAKVNMLLPSGAVLEIGVTHKLTAADMKVLKDLHGDNLKHLIEM